MSENTPKNMVKKWFLISLALLILATAAFWDALWTQQHLSQGGRYTIEGETVAALADDFSFSLELENGIVVDVSCPPYNTITPDGTYKNKAKRPVIVDCRVEGFRWSTPDLNVTYLQESIMPLVIQKFSEHGITPQQ